MSSWGCPHEEDGLCRRANRSPCDAGMKGCVLFGRFLFSNPTKNRRTVCDAPVIRERPATKPDWEDAPSCESTVE